MTSSVIIPVYNGGLFIKDCLESLLKQTCPPLEIIVVNDGSTDDTAEIAKRFNVALLSHSQNQGAAAARQHGAAKAKGEILVFLDADCIAPPDWLEAILKEFDADSNLGGVGGRYVHPRHSSITGLMSKLEEEFAHSIFSLHPFRANPPGGNSAFVKKVWDRSRSGLEVYLFRGLPSGEDNLVCNEVRKHARVKFSESLQVIHQPLPASGYFRRHFNRGRSRALAQAKALSPKDDLTLAAYGGYSLFISSLALSLFILLLPLVPFKAGIFGGAALGLFLAHLWLSRPFFGFVKKVNANLPAGEKISVPERIQLSLLLVCRSFCWMAGAGHFFLKRVLLSLKRHLNVVHSIAHFWRPGRISKLFYFVTSACNARCEFCFNLENVVNWKERKPVELSLEEVKAIARHLKRLPYINLSGGEPFMRQDLPDVIEVFHKICRTQWATIPTNASLTKITLQMTQEILTRCPGLFLTIQVSMDSMYEEHDKSRKVKGSFEGMTRTLKGLVALRKYYPDLRIQIATCYDEFNVDRIPEMISYCRENFDYDQQMFYLIREDGNLITQSKNHLIDSFRETLRENEEYEWARHRKTLWSRAVRALQGITYNDMLLIKRDKTFIRPCHATQKFVTLYDDGQISPCEVLEPVSLGNIRDFNYDFYALIRRKAAADYYKKEIVEKKCNCDWTCATPMNMLYDPKTFPRLVKALFQPDKAAQL